MNRQKVILLLIALALMGGAAGVLARMKSGQKLGEPGVRAERLGAGINLRVLLPEQVLEYRSEEIPLDAMVTNTLPADTSFGQRRYIHEQDANEWLLLNVVLMGTDRTSLHKPQYCLEGMGWDINHAASEETAIPVGRPQPYELPVIKLVAARTFQNAQGQTIPARAVYVYWFVADGALSGDMAGWERMWWMASHLLRTGELQRWAYVSCLAVCPPGQEDATFERMKRFIAAAVPEFQLTPKLAPTAAVQP